MSLPKVSFAFVNCNRLHYLKSCVESLLDCTSDYENKDLIIIDNASVENGTEDYLKEKEQQGFRIVRQPERDPSNEFAKALNLICEMAEGDYVVPLQADMQFIVKGKWLHRYVQFAESIKDNIGCICLDAQRKITINGHKFSKSMGDDFKFFVDYNRPPIACAADVFLSKKIIEMIYPWQERNKNHEGGEDSETKMLMKTHKLIQERQLNVGCFVPLIPVACAIYTDRRGTNARVRGNRRYGDYWAPKEGHQYYEYQDFDEIVDLVSPFSEAPVSIEMMVEPIGFEKMLDSQGNWLKNPINPELAVPSDFMEL